jgi:hypothetical protein
MHSFSYYLGFYNFKIFWIFFLDFSKFYPGAPITSSPGIKCYPGAHTKCARGKKNYPRRTIKFASDKHYRQHVGHR